MEEPTKLAASTIADARDGEGVVGAEIRHVAGPPRVAGPAYTLELRPGDNLGLHLAIARASPGDVVVAVAGAEPFGAWGEITTLAAVEAGLAGLVIDGFVRDAREIDAHRFPVFARGTCIRKTGKHDPGRHGVPVELGGVAVEPGDLVVGDADGIVVVPRARAEETLARAERIEVREREVLAGLRAGRTTLELLGLPSQPVTGPEQQEAEWRT